MIKELRKDIHRLISTSNLDDNGGLYTILFLAIVLYFQQSWVPGFFQDGYLYSVLGKNASEMGHWLVPFQSKTTYPEFDQHPPFIFILEGLFFKAVGFSYTTARLFSGFWALASVLYVFHFFKGLDKTRWGFFSCMILILIPSLLKKSRFPGLDVPLMFFFIMALGSYYLAEFKGKKTHWYLCGLAAGLALLTKGFPGLIIPAIILIHLIITKRGRSLLGLHPWLGLSLSFLIFSVWPIGLYSIGKFQIFESYVNTQLFNTMLEGRGTVEVNYFLYFVHLLKTCFPWVLASFFGAKMALKKENKELFLLFLVWFLVVLIPLSLIKFKYSHYIIPLYPALAVMAGYFFFERNNEFQNKIYSGLRILVPVVALVLLIFPLTTKIRRHKEVFKTLEVLRLYDHSPRAWYVVDDAIEYYSTSSLSSLEMKANPRRINSSDYLKLLNKQVELENMLGFVSGSFYSKYQGVLDKLGLSVLLELPQKDVFILVKMSVRNLKFSAAKKGRK